MRIMENQNELTWESFREAWEYCNSSSVREWKVWVFAINTKRTDLRRCVQDHKVNFIRDKALTALVDKTTFPPSRVPRTYDDHQDLLTVPLRPV
jgi:hypothetical protein